MSPKLSDENQYLSIMVVRIPAPVITDKSCHLGRGKESSGQLPRLNTLNVVFCLGDAFLLILTINR